MSWLSRFRKRFRSEGWQNLYEYSDDKTVPSTFIPDLIEGEFTNKDQWQHQLKVAREDPIAYRICVLLPRNVFDDWFILRKKKKLEEGEEPEEHPKNQQIQEEFHRMRAKYWFTQALTGMATFGSSALVFNMNAHRTDLEGVEGYQVASLDVFTPENSEIPEEAYDTTTGEPAYIIVRPNAAYGDVTERIYWDELIWWCTDPQGRSYDGYSWIYAAWDTLTQNREAMDAMMWAYKKFGVGLAAFYLKGGLDDEIKSALETMMQGVSNKRSVAIEGDKYEKIEWIGPTGTMNTNIVEGMDYGLGLISSATGIPKDIFTGVSAGAITGSEINNKALYATISKVQSDVEPYVYETIERMGYDTEDMLIEWNTRYATDEMEQATIRNLNADAKLKEAQAEQGDIRIGVQGFNDPEQNRNPAGVQG